MRHAKYILVLPVTLLSTLIGFVASLLLLFPLVYLAGKGIIPNPGPGGAIAGFMLGLCFVSIGPLIVPSRRLVVGATLFCLHLVLLLILWSRVGIDFFQATDLSSRGGVIWLWLQTAAQFLGSILGIWFVYQVEDIAFKPSLKRFGRLFFLSIAVIYGVAMFWFMYIMSVYSFTGELP